MSWISPADETSVNSESSPDVWTVQKVLNWSTNWLKEKCVDKEAIGVNPRLESELLLGSVLECDRMKLYLQLDRPLNKAERDSYKVLLRRRVDGEPIYYILGYRDFFRYRFIVNKSVLVPRPDTEILVEKCIEILKSVEKPNILEVGVGSGCIAISLAKEFPISYVTGWDISNEAIAVAQKNAMELQCKNVAFCEIDVFKPQLDAKYDLIVSNPPYISRNEINGLSSSVKNFEPHVALFDDRGAKDGLSFYRALAELSIKVLNPGGSIAVECGHEQSQKVLEIFSRFGLTDLTITKDLAGIGRVVSGTFELPF